MCVFVRVVDNKVFIIYNFFFFQFLSENFISFNRSSRVPYEKILRPTIFFPRFYFISHSFSPSHPSSERAYVCIAFRFSRAPVVPWRRRRSSVCSRAGQWLQRLRRWRMMSSQSTWFPDGAPFVSLSLAPAGNARFRVLPPVEHVVLCSWMFIVGMWIYFVPRKFTGKSRSFRLYFYFIFYSKFLFNEFLY